MSSVVVSYLSQCRVCFFSAATFYFIYDFTHNLSYIFSWFDVLCSKHGRDFAYGLHMYCCYVILRAPAQVSLVWFNGSVNVCFSEFACVFVCKYVFVYVCMTEYVLTTHGQTIFSRNMTRIRMLFYLFALCLT